MNDNTAITTCKRIPITRFYKTGIFNPYQHTWKQVREELINALDSEVGFWKNVESLDSVQRKIFDAWWEQYKEALFSDYLFWCNKDEPFGLFEIDCSLSATLLSWGKQ